MELWWEPNVIAHGWCPAQGKQREERERGDRERGIYGTGFLVIRTDDHQEKEALQVKS